MKVFRFVLALCLLVASAAMSATTAELLASQPAYVVQPGDTLWALSGEKLGDPLVWKQIVEDNTLLKQKGRVFEKDGKVIVLVRPGEKLYGLEKYVSILPVPTPVASATSLPNLTTVPFSVLPADEGLPWWVKWLIAIIALAVAAYFLVEYMLTRDAATSGPAMVPGGVDDATAGNQFRLMAAQHHQVETGRALPVQQFNVLRQEAGRISGVLNVRYADGKTIPRRLTGERAYRAQVRFPNGSEETLYMLQGCGNDLKYGGVSRYMPGPEFSFIADTEPLHPGDLARRAGVDVGAAPSPVTAPAAPVAEVPARDGSMHVEFRPEAEGQPNMLRMRGVSPDFSFDTAPDGTMTVRFRKAS